MKADWLAPSSAINYVFIVNQIIIPIAFESRTKTDSCWGWAKGILHPRGNQQHTGTANTWQLFQKTFYSARENEENEHVKFLYAFPSSVFLFCLISPYFHRILAPISVPRFPLCAGKNEKVMDYFRELVAISLMCHWFDHYFVTPVNPSVPSRGTRLIVWILHASGGFTAEKSMNAIE